jgi:hypothetical protein
MENKKNIKDLSDILKTIKENSDKINLNNPTTINKVPTTNNNIKNIFTKIVNWFKLK